MKYILKSLSIIKMKIKNEFWIVSYIQRKEIIKLQIS
jgi:hypothetical protein